MAGDDRPGRYGPDRRARRHRPARNYCDYLAAQPASARHVSDVTASLSADIAAVVARRTSPAAR